MRTVRLEGLCSFRADRAVLARAKSLIRFFRTSERNGSGDPVLRNCDRGCLSESDDAGRLFPGRFVGQVCSRIFFFYESIINELYRKRVCFERGSLRFASGRRFASVSSMRERKCVFAGFLYVFEEKSGFPSTNEMMGIFFVRSGRRRDLRTTGVRILPIATF